MTTKKFKVWLDSGANHQSCYEQEIEVDGDEWDDRSTSEGEAAWREWYDTNIALCGMAQELVRAALAKAEGKS